MGVTCKSCVGDDPRLAYDIHWMPLDLAQKIARPMFSGPMQIWRPCQTEGCAGAVIYARSTNANGEPGFRFMPTLTFSQAKWPILFVKNVEDFSFEPTPGSAASDKVSMDPRDLILIRAWLKRGLREAILNAPEGA